jgi:predicted Zn-dependent protease
MASEEVDADKIAIRALHATGHDVNAWVTLLEKLRKNLAAGQAKVLAKTHPKVEDRMQLVHAYLKNNPNAVGRTNEQRFTRYAHP